MNTNFQDYIEDGKGEIWLFRAKQEGVEKSFNVYSFKNTHVLNSGADFLTLKDGVTTIVANQTLLYIDKGSETLTTTFGDFQDLKVGPNYIAESSETRVLFSLLRNTGKLKKINLKTQMSEPLPHSSLLTKRFRSIKG